MLFAEPAFLPLQPLFDVAYPHCTSGTTLPASCSIASLRQSFHPFPLRPATPSTPSRRLGDLEAWRERKPAHNRRDLTIRGMRGNDVAAVKQLQSACLPLEYPASFYTLLLTNPSSLCLLAVSSASPVTILGSISGHILPYTHCALSDDDETSARTTGLPIIYVTSLAVDELARHQGIGFRLVQRLVLDLLSSSTSTSSDQDATSRAAVLHLHVEAKNEAAIRLYERVGLRETRKIRGYYKGVSGGGDAVEMKGVVGV